MGQREAWLGDTQGKGKSHYCPCLRQQDGPPWGWAVWQEGDGTASTGSPTPSGVGLGEAVGWHVSLWDRCPYKKRRGHQRRVALRVRPRDRTGVRRQGREAWPGPALLTARCGPPPLELRITVCCFGPRLSCFVRQPWQTKPTLLPVHGRPPSVGARMSHPLPLLQKPSPH